MIRRPPRSTLFPYTRSSDLTGLQAVSRLTAGRSRTATPQVSTPDTTDIHRSEEHTSELQSQSNLVCRLLLEKKKKIKSSSILDVIVLWCLESCCYIVLYLIH